MAEQNQAQQQVSYEELAQAYTQTANKLNRQLEVNQNLQNKIARDANQAAETEATLNTMTTYAEQLENELKGYREEKAQQEQQKQNRQQKRQAAKNQRKEQSKTAAAKS